MKSTKSNIKRKTHNRITLSIEFIDQLEYFDAIEWEDIMYVVERMNNQIEKPTTLGHVFNKNFEPVFIEFSISIRPKRECLFTSLEQISSDRYLDLMLEGRILKLSNEIIREIEK